MHGSTVNPLASRFRRICGRILMLYSTSKRLSLSALEAAHTETVRPNFRHTGRYADRDISDGRRRNNRRSQPKPSTHNALALRLAIHYMAILGDCFCCDSGMYDHLHCLN